MFIYQIGNEVIRGIAEHTTSVKWTGEDKQSSQFPLVSFTNRYSVPETVEVKLKGVLNIHKDVNPITKLNRIIKMGGSPYIDIIGYLPSGFNGAPYCAVPETDLVNYFFHTYGMITDVDREYNLDTDTDDQFQVLELSMTLKINPYWTPLNRYMWFPYYHDDVPDSFELSQLYTDSVADTTWLETYYDRTAIEGRNSLTNKPYYITPTGILDWHYRAPFTFYRNQSYDTNLLYSSYYFPEWCKYSEQGVGYQSSADITSLIVSNPFSGDIKYLHIFDFLNPADMISVEITSEISPFEIRTHTSTFDCSILHNILLQPEFGGGGMASSTQIVVGNDEIASCYVMNGFNQIIRSSITGQILVPEWTYTTRMPCELFGGKNRIVINNEEDRIFRYAALMLNRAL